MCTLRHRIVLITHRHEASEMYYQCGEVLGSVQCCFKILESGAVSRRDYLNSRNRLISGKNVSFSFSEDYDFVPSLLAQTRVSSSNTSAPRSGENRESSNWCAFVTFTRTHFTRKSVLNANGTGAERVSPPPSPQSGTPA